MHSQDTFAARAGRWSAQHRKKAILGLARVRRDRLRRRRHARHEKARQPERVRRPVRARRPARRPAFPKHDERERPRSRRAAAVMPTDASVRRAVRDVMTAVGAQPRRRRRQVALRQGQRGPDLQGRPLRARDLRGQRRRATAPRQAQSTRSRPPSRRGRRANPSVFVGQFGDASAEQGAVEVASTTTSRRPRLLSLPDHADHPRARLRRARRRRRAAAARPDRRRGHARPARLPSQLVPIDDIISVIVLLIGLAVGVDYSLFYLRREREERGARRRQARGASHIAAATSGRAVLVLGPDRDGRDGRHVPRRRHDVHGAAASARSWSSPSR